MKHSFILFLMVVLCACNEEIKVSKTIPHKPILFPDYSGITIPINIAPLNFSLADSVDYRQVAATFCVRDYQLVVRGTKKQIRIDENTWRKLLQKACGDSITIKLLCKESDQWKEFQPFTWHVSPDSIDSYLAYRLIEPGYELWNEMGIYQRCLENFNETPIIRNVMTDNNCMNCHSFCMQDPSKMLFHMRAALSGTYVIQNGNMEKLNTKTDQTISAFVYPSWHPSGNFVAFSVNETKQNFHSSDKNRIEVYDQKSDVVVYDVGRHEIVTAPALFSQSHFETFPTFSPDGRTLYFCTADSVTMPQSYDKLRYNICSIPFNPTTREFGETIDTLYHCNQVSDLDSIKPWERKSASFPRVSPDGSYLMFTLSAYGNFSIWHQDADIYLLRIADKKLMPAAILNSQSVESYHSWSSNSRWVVFSSRRMDGLYTRPFFAHVTSDGQCSKPFVLPCEDVGFYKRFMKSYNIPEFIKDEVKLSASGISRLARTNKGVDINAPARRGKSTGL